MISEISKERHWLFFLLYAGAILFAIAPVMRESDQASLIDGALQIARDGELLGRDFYNYDKQYGSYLILAAVYKILGLDVVGANSEFIVHAGNWVAGGVFLAGLGGIFSRWRPTGVEMLLGMAVLLCPVLLFSALFLSSNIISAGILCALAGLLRSYKEGWIRTLTMGALGFVAVACRADAVLVLPWLCVLSSREETWSSLLRDARYWSVGLGSCLALLAGGALSESQAASYASFFDAKVSSAFLVFGLSSALVLYCALLLKLVFEATKQRSLFLMISLLAALCPFLFYGRILFTPRHLVTTALIVLFSLFFERSRSWWALVDRRALKLVMIFLIGIPFLFGIRLNSLKAGNLVIQQPTLFPSADGFWPMGCYGCFFVWLAKADRLPVDHNQRVWSAWTKVDSMSADSEVYSKGGVSFGLLRATILGVESSRVNLENQDETKILFTDGRTVTRNQVKVGVNSDRDERELMWPAGIALVGDAEWEQIYRAGGEGLEEGIPEPWNVRLALAHFSGGNDFFLGTPKSPWQNLRGGGPFRWIALTHRNVEPGGGWRFLGKAEGWELYEFFSNEPPSSQAGWLARSALPKFFVVGDFVAP